MDDIFEIVSDGHYKRNGEEFYTRRTRMDETTSYWCCYDSYVSAYGDSEVEAILLFLDKKEYDPGLPAR